ncbi:MAG TPA: DegV family protein [Terrisporobacter glycolicus]|uniref:DegV domain-containing protein n=1 Tax=Terrisporobacter petrolearius TaxID=1460447 RepID=A0ABZ3FHL8_9FIRM|nr:MULTISPECIES: DegV family protein [Terrisporobacter]MBN9648357.1 DegV family protein [Terrisporobacter glycolicus]UPA30262.1 DegV family protein [Terrisporobacter glycolicus]SFJ62534.1 EDD domain protein, DegV family [Terrisporobacter glycolicus]HBI92321.1 DegV family protein [Terrisporobacter hibernicus]
MNEIKIICDSLSDVNKEYLEKYDIDVVPLTVILNEKEYRDGIDMQPEEFYRILREENAYPKTSQATYAQFKEIFDKYTKDGKKILYISGSAAATGTCQSAIMAKNDTEGEIYIYDSNNLTFGAGFFVVKAAEMINEGKTIEEVFKALDEIKEKYVLMFSVDTLEYLKKGGRISSTKATVGSLLNIKPILEVKDGLVSQVGQVRGKKNVLNKMIECIKERLGDDLEQEEVYIGYSDDLKEREKLTEIAKEVFKPKKIGYFIIGTCVGSHSGPGVGGILVFKK